MSVRTCLQLRSALPAAGHQESERVLGSLNHNETSKSSLASGLVSEDGLAPLHSTMSRDGCWYFLCVRVVI